MITIFSSPRPFKGKFKILQYNALASWRYLCPDCEIILIEDEEQTTQPYADKFQAKCISNIKVNPEGVYYLNDIFKKVKKIAKNPILAHVNADIILTKSFFDSISKIKDQSDMFYMIGRRWNLNVEKKINFLQKWEPKLIKKLNASGQIHPPTGIDYWVFSKSIDWPLPPFLVGRPAADNWLIYYARLKNIPVIDTTAVATVIHQNHPRPFGDSSYLKQRENNQKLYRKNTKNTRLDNYYFDVTDATLKLGARGHLKRRYFLKLWLKNLVYARYAPQILDQNKIYWIALGSIINPFLDFVVKQIKSAKNLV